MKTKNSGLFVLVSAVGVIMCVAVMLGFVMTIENNNLPWAHGADSVRDHYNGVTDSWSEGFLVGFFLCLFLMMGAISLRSWLFGKVDRYYERRARLQGAEARTEAPPAA